MVAPSKPRASADDAQHVAYVRSVFPLGSRCVIEETEHRGMQLIQLGRAINFARQQVQFWCDKRNGGVLLSIEVVNLYHLAEWLIKPATSVEEGDTHCSMVELLCALAQLPQWFVSHWERLKRAQALFFLAPS